MAKTKITKTKTITLSEKEGAFSTIFHRFKGKKAHSSEIANLRQLLSNERARILHIIKTRQPASIYELAKLLGRDFKAVREDIRLLEKFGFIELKSETKGKRKKLRPILSIENLQVNISFK